jgi:5,10-methenyltetrahydrofolate synthetase
MTTAHPSAEHAAESSVFRAALRREKLAARMALDETRHATLSVAITRHLESLLGQRRPQTLAFCAPVQGEFDARPLVTRLIAQGWHAAMPVIETAAAPMVFRAWQPDSPMTVDRHGIPIPADRISASPDLILLPLVAFDALGYRLGYGGGYFDRTLATMVPRPYTVGIGFELARSESIRPEIHDIALDVVVTDAGVFYTPSS